MIAVAQGVESFAYSIAPDGAGTRLGPEAGALSGAAFLWRHIDGRDARHCAWLSAQSGIPETVVAALTSVETRPRVGLVGDGALVNLRGPNAEADADATDLVSIRIWVERGLLLTMNFRDTDAIATMEHEIARRRVRDEGDFITELAKAMTDRLVELLGRLSGELDTIEEEVIAERGGALRSRIGSARRAAIELRRHMGPQREALLELAAGVLPIFEDNDRAHLAEAANSVTRMLEEIESIREQGLVLFEQLSDLRQEFVAKRTLVLSTVSMIFLPLSFVAGLIGMNVPIPWQTEPWTFWAIIAACAVVGGGLWLALRLWARKRFD